MSEYLVVIEQEGESWGAYCLDLPGLGVVGDSQEESRSRNRPQSVRRGSKYPPRDPGSRSAVGVSSAAKSRHGGAADDDGPNRYYANRSDARSSPGRSRSDDQTSFTNLSTERPACRRTERNVPGASSRWSGTIAVLPASFRSLM